MTYKKHRPPLTLAQFLHFLDGFLAKFHVAHGKHFVNHKDFGVEIGCYGKAQAHFHARTIAFHWCINKAFATRKVNNFI